MKYLLLLLLLCCSQIWAQSPGDSIIVNSFDYTMTYGIGERDTVVDFPDDPSVSYEKILMLYNMRCKNGLVSGPQSGQRSIGCGEWDYSCNTYIIDSTRADSIARKTPNYKIAGFTGTSFDYLNSPGIDFHQKILTETILNSTISETQYVLGSNNAPLNHAFPFQHYVGKSQYLYTASELSALGMLAGNIDGFIIFPINTVSVDFCKIKIKHTTLTAMEANSGADTSGFTEVFFDDLDAYAFPQGHRVMFKTPFVWDGVSNIIVEFSFTNSTGNGGFTIPEIEGSSTSFVSAISSHGEQFPVFQSQNYLEIPNYKGVTGTTPRTVEAWVKTTQNNGEIVSWGLNNNTQKWIVRVNGGGQLRTEVAGGYIVGTTLINDGKWHHIASTFNGTNVSNIKLYVDGQLELISSIGQQNINTASGSNLSIAHGHNNTYFDGYIDNIRIWSTDLSQTIINEWKNQKISNSHPNYTNLELALNKDSINTSSWVDASPYARNAQVIGGQWLDRTDGEAVFKDFERLSERPDLSFFNGQYTTSTVLDTAWLQVPRRPNTVQTCVITDNSGTISSDVVDYDSVSYLWDASLGNQYFDESGSLINSVPTPSSGTLTVMDLDYKLRSPMAFEIMSFVTPYGINLDLGMEGKTWTFDVTDFAPILKGPKRIIMNKGGQWQEDMDIKFVYIVGTPPAPVMDISNIWNSNRQVSYNSVQAGEVFAARSIIPDAGASRFKIRSTITGHGQQGEFISRTHNLKLNGSNVQTWNAWKICGSNPVYPQGGTWIYDRAGWCPGMATDLLETDLTSLLSAGTPATIDYDITSASGDSRYIVSHQLVSYGSPEFTKDARVDEIQYPSDRVEYARRNPNCQDPKIVLRNTGSTTMTSAKVKCWINNSSSSETYTWSGSLDFMVTAHFVLPASSILWDGVDRSTDNTFHAKIVEVNGSMDDYAQNDELTSNFDIPEVFPSKLAFLIRTNNAPNETTYEIIDETGNKVFSKKYNVNSTLIRDTALLGPGCYTLQVTDSDGDGISFWANNDGNGSMRILNANNGAYVKLLQGDFGNENSINFTVEWPLKYEDVQNFWPVQIYPNPSQDIVHVNAKDVYKAEVSLFNTIGQKVEIPMTSDTNELLLDISTLAPGVYSLQMILGDHSINRQIMKE